MWRQLLIAMAVFSTAKSETTVSVNDVKVIPMTTEEPITEFSLQISHLESSTSAITFLCAPRVPKWMKVESYDITASKKGSGAVMTYPKQPGDTVTFEVNDLVRDSQFEVCVTCHVLNNTEPVEFLECFDSFTIPFFRPDSLYVLSIVIGYFLAMVLIGYIAWRCAVYKAKKEAAEAAYEEVEEDKVMSSKQYAREEEKPILLPSPTDEPVKSSIEDDYQPNMTPPWTVKERNGKQNRSTANSHV